MLGSPVLERLWIGASSRQFIIVLCDPIFEGCERLMRFNLAGSEYTITALGEVGELVTLEPR